MIAGVTGPTAAFGIPTRSGATLAIEDLNAQGGQQYELLVEDDQGRPEQTAASATKLITRDGVKLLIAADSSSRSLAAAPIAQAARIPMITPTASLPAVTEKGDYIFRVCATDADEARAMAAYTLDTLKLRHIATLRDSRNDYSVGVAEIFQKAFTARGGQVILTLDYAEGDADMRGQLVSIREAKPDAIFVPGYYGDIAQILIQARDLGITQPFLGGSGWNSPALLDVAKSAANGSWFMAPIASQNASFKERYTKRFGREPDGPTALAYDAVALAVDAMKRAKSTDGPAVREALAQTRGFSGMSGTFDIGADRNPKKAIGVYTVRDAKFEMVGEVMP